MSAKSTLLWIFLAAGLFGFIYFFHRYAQQNVVGSARVLPALRAQRVTSILVRPAGPAQLQIRADRTNGTWELTQPLAYPAQGEKVQALLAFLEKLSPAPYIAGSELRNRPNADQEFGFAAPQATILVQQGDYRPRLLVGSLTNPGDQVFVQVEGDLGAYVVDAQLLAYLPRSANDWRDTTLINVAGIPLDRIAVTNNAKGDANRAGLPASSSTFVLQRDTTNHLWRMIWPLDARADQSRIDAALQKLQQLRVRQFVSDDPRSDLEPLGLSPAELDLGFANGTNVLALVQFGRCPTNETSRVYARRSGQTGVFTVDKDLLLGWCAFLNDFRDPRLLSSIPPLDSIEIMRGEEHSAVVSPTEGTWQVLPGEFPADPGLMASFVSALTNLQVTKFVNDVVNASDLPGYGLAPPLARFILKSDDAGSAGNPTNLLVTELDFGLGTNAPDWIFAKRSDESFVYAISTNAFARLPSAAWRLRDRKLCHFSAADVAGVTLHLRAKTCRLIHKAPLSWSFAPGSQGIINDGAIEETIRGITQVSAIDWVARGEAQLPAYGFRAGDYHVALELKNGQTFDLEFGGAAPSGNVYAAIALEGQPWILEFPWIFYRDISAYLPLGPEG